MLKRDSLWEGGYSFYFDDSLFYLSSLELRNRSFCISGVVSPVNGIVVSDTGSHQTIQLQPGGYFKVTITSSDKLGKYGSSATYFKMTNVVQSI